VEYRKYLKPDYHFPYMFASCQILECSLGLVEREHTVDERVQPDILVLQKLVQSLKISL
jgi:hypothetical protein